MKKLLFALVFVPSIIFSQSRKERKALEAQQKADQVVISNLKNHIQNLASATTPDGETKSVDYISNQFRSLGLLPKGTDGYIQSFKVENGKSIEPSTSLKVNDKLLEVNKDYFPLSYSAEKRIKGSPAMALRERGVPWFVDLKDWLEDGSKYQGNIDDLIKKETAKVALKGATAFFLYNSGTASDGISFNAKDKSSALSIPVIYLTREGKSKYFSDHSDVIDIELNVAFKETATSGTNVIGYLDNSAPSTVVISAHYHTNTPASASKSVVNGANDNGSGVATLIELARMLSASKPKYNNYTFIATGGSDMGITATNYWLDHSTISAPVNYLLNLDMVGTYGDGRKLLVEGYNSSPWWSELFASLNDRKIEMIIDSSAVVNSAALSKKGIPHLSFSSSAHADYLHSADEEAKINYAGTLQVARFINRLVEATDGKGKLAFVKMNENVGVENLAKQAVKPAKADESPAATKATVSLGVIPDKVNADNGLKISGVTPKKLASKIGLQPGDVLINLGSYQISDLKSYIQALSNFKAGDKTTLRIKRGKDDKEFAVEF